MGVPRTFWSPEVAAEGFYNNRWCFDKSNDIWCIGITLLNILMSNIFGHLDKLKTITRYNDINLIYDNRKGLQNKRYYETNIKKSIGIANDIMKREIRSLFSDKEERRYFDGITIGQTIIEFFNKIFVEKKNRATEND